jgi:outer membrane protein OmpA-like peptidoglycan-associated protein
MKTLIIGFIAFFIWSVGSTHYYVCRIKKLCDVKGSDLILSTIEKPGINSDSLKSISKPEKAAIPGTMTVNFAFDKAEFNPDPSTDNYFIISKAYLDQNNTARLSITGHTDAVGSDEYNQALGYRRAQSLQTYFESKGLATGKISVASKGEKDPADDNSSISGRANNRRTVITINN